MADAEEQKQTKDYSDLVRVEIPRITEPVKKQPAKLKEAIDELLALEKKTRLAADANSTRDVALAILGLCRDVGDWKTLNEQVSLLSKRRAQLKKVVQAIVQTGSTWVDEVKDIPTKMELISSLRTVAEGKIFVELERARLTRQLAELMEKEGKIGDAADVIQEVQVETIGSMHIREKADYLLEQVRMCLEKKDFVRAQIISNKIKPAVLDDLKLQDLKLKYNNLMIQYYTHNKDYFLTCKAYRNIYLTPDVQADAAQWKPALHHAVLYLALSPYDAEWSDTIFRFKADKKLRESKVAKLIVDLFTKAELIAWPLAVDDSLKSDPIFTSADGKDRYELLKKRAVQHNLRTISGYYESIKTSRLAELLFLDQDKTEEYLSELVSSKQLFAKVDRPAGIVCFIPKQSPAATLNEWSGDIDKLLGLVDSTCHLISKENMLHKIQATESD